MASASGQEPPQCQRHSGHADGDPENNPHRQVRAAHAELRVALLLRWLMMLGHGAYSLGRGCAPQTSRWGFVTDSTLQGVRHSSVNRSGACSSVRYAGGIAGSLSDLPGCRVEASLPPDRFSLMARFHLCGPSGLSGRLVDRGHTRAKAPLRACYFPKVVEHDHDEALTKYS